MNIFDALISTDLGLYLFVVIATGIFAWCFNMAEIKYRAYLSKRNFKRACYHPPRRFF